MSITRSKPGPRWLASLYRTVRAVADADRRYPGEGYAWEDNPWPPSEYLRAGAAAGETLWHMMGEADRAIRAARQVKARLEALLLANVQEYGAVRYGNDVYYEGRDAEWRWDDPDSSPRELLGWLTATAHDREQMLDTIDRAIRIDAKAVRLTTVRELATAVGFDPQLVVGTFLVREGEDTPVLSQHRATVKQCPKWALTLAHGERRGSRKPLKTKETPDA